MVLMSSVSPLCTSKQEEEVKELPVARMSPPPWFSRASASWLGREGEIFL